MSLWSGKNDIVPRFDWFFIDDSKTLKFTWFFKTFQTINSDLSPVQLCAEVRFRTRKKTHSHKHTLDGNSFRQFHVFSALVLHTEPLCHSSSSSKTLLHRTPPLSQQTAAVTVCLKMLPVFFAFKTGTKVVLHLWNSLRPEVRRHYT